MSKVIINFARYSDEELDNRTRDIILSMTNNAAFAAPVPSLAETQTALTAYQDAQSQATKGGKDRTAVKKQKRSELEKLLKRLAYYVEAISASDEVILLSSGFELTKTREVVGLMSKPRIQVETTPVPGTIKVIVDSVAGAKAYIYAGALAPVNDATTWDIQTSTSSTFVFTNLQQRKEYAFRVAGIGAHPSRIYSEVVTIFVQ